MITVVKKQAFRYKDGRFVYLSDMYGLSTDKKPTDVENASSFVEMDTGTISLFDAENSVWREFGGGS